MCLTDAPPSWKAAVGHFTGPPTTESFHDFNNNPVAATCEIADGECSTLLLVPLVSGEYRVTATLLNDERVADSQPFGVLVENLVGMPPSTLYDLTGQFDSVRCTEGSRVARVTSRHPDNHWATERLVRHLERIGASFEQHTGFRMRVNDLSLRLGGLFDIGNDWAIPHQAHRNGENADIELSVGDIHGCMPMSQAEIQELQLMILGETGTWPSFEGNHLHLNRPQR